MFLAWSIIPFMCVLYALIMGIRLRSKRLILSAILFQYLSYIILFFTYYRPCVGSLNHLIINSVLFLIFMTEPKKKYTLPLAIGIPLYIFVRGFMYERWFTWYSMVFYVIVAIVYYLYVYPRSCSVYPFIFTYATVSDLRELGNIFIFSSSPTFWRMYVYFYDVKYYAALYAYLLSNEITFTKKRLLAFIAIVAIANIIEYTPIHGLLKRLAILPAIFTIGYRRDKPKYGKIQ